MSKKVLVPSLEAPFGRISEEYLELSVLINEFQQLKKCEHLSTDNSVFKLVLENKILCFQKHLLKLGYQIIQLEQLLNRKSFTY
jgi:hypothetical protein